MPYVTLRAGNAQQSQQRPNTVLSLVLSLCAVLRAQPHALFFVLGITPYQCSLASGSCPRVDSFIQFHTGGRGETPTEHPPRIESALFAI